MTTPLTVNWLMKDPAEILALAREHRDSIVGRPDPRRVSAFWFKAGAMHVIVTPHPPLEPRPRWTWRWWEWVRAKSRWADLVMHELDHARRDSVEHPPGPI